MKDEDYFQATMLDFQEVRILHSHSDNHTHTLCTIMYLSVDQPHSQACLKEPGNEAVG